MIQLGNTARRVREKKGLTQRATAQALGITPVHLSNFENNKVNPTKALLDRYRELWGIDLYILAWCLEGDPEELPAAIRGPMRALTKAWIAELGEMGPDDPR
jgi:transcriptional regulator with XRE-family HTH domain